LSNTAIYNYLSEVVQREASDIYLTVGVPPTLRIDDKLIPLPAEPMTEEDVQAILLEILTPRQRLEFDTNMELNMALDLGKEGRFRINVMRQRQHPALVIRRITSRIPNFEQLHLPKTMEKLALEKRGMILICGITSSGKSTLASALIDYRNTVSGGHIITIEDPVEFYHEHKKGIVTQREVGIDTASYSVALKNALRQKPDVILVGEIRYQDVMIQAIAAAETGHTCYATLHTTNATQAIERIIGFFPEDRHQQVRISLSMNLRAIVALRLVPAVKGGVVMVPEILLNEALVKELIMKGETNKIYEVMSNNNAAGMVTFDQSLLSLYKQGLITQETAMLESDHTADMKIKLQQHKMSQRSPVSSLDLDIDTSRLSL
jgi:twitching motility protein PilU